MLATVPSDDEDSSHTVGLGIVLDDVHYARTVQLPGPKNPSDKDPGEVLAQAVSPARLLQNRHVDNLACSAPSEKDEMNSDLHFFFELLSC